MLKTRAWTLGAAPSQCEVCRSWGAERLCAACLQRFAPPRARCRRCALPVDGGAALCGACTLQPPPFERSLCVADYAFPWDRLVSDFKFHGNVELAAVLARPLAQAVAAAADERPQWVLPVPLSPQRLAERGYNQAWELARCTAARLGCRCSALMLERPLDNRHQAALGLQERQANMRGAFLVPPQAQAALQGSHVALVDDVMTTGATAREAAHTLLRAGAARVDLWVLARTP